MEPESKPPELWKRRGKRGQDASRQRGQDSHSKSRSPKHRRGDGPRYNPTLDAVTRPERPPEGDELLPIGE